MLKWSRQIDYGQPAPDFALPDTAGAIQTLGEFQAPALLVAFICNHCPVVLHMLDGLCDFAREYAPKGLQVVAISSNDPAEFPEDSYEHMQAFAKDRDLPFLYLYDESQDVALAYGAICTPDFFLYGADRTLYFPSIESRCLFTAASGTVTLASFSVRPRLAGRSGWTRSTPIESGTRKFCDSCGELVGGQSWSGSARQGGRGPWKSTPGLRILESNSSSFRGQS